MPDEVARKLEICDSCSRQYIAWYGKDRFDELRTRISGDDIHDVLSDAYCPCGHHPEREMMRWVGSAESGEEGEQLVKRVKTLRMYLGGEFND